MFTSEVGEYPKCPVCARGQTSGLHSLCDFHETALDNIRRGYAEWIRGYDSLAKKEYLRVLIKNSSADEWIIEVAEYLLREGLADSLGDPFARGSE
jgi:hypothetical protein